MSLGACTKQSNSPNQQVKPTVGFLIGTDGMLVSNRAHPKTQKVNVPLPQGQTTGKLVIRADNRTGELHNLGFVNQGANDHFTLGFGAHAVNDLEADVVAGTYKVENEGDPSEGFTFVVTLEPPRVTA